MYIITGASKGLGSAMAQKLLEGNSHLICLSRTKNRALLQLAEEKNAKLDYIEADLSVSGKSAGLMDKIFSLIHKDETQLICLINNAGTVQPVGPADKISEEDIEKSIMLNLIAPMQLTSSFLRNCAEHDAEARVMNISSGAGRKTYSGWSSYCAGKAGLDHFTRSCVMEQEEKQTGIKLVSIAPGIIDTEMQQEIRSSSKEEFSLHEKFVNYKKNRELASPEETAEKLLRVLHSPDFGAETIMDVRNV
ncbi:(S)-benzoin forming benzil reductase [Metabacillus sp. GX 13764]|uniref:(S)-benzoin forming benzil reductase n=1 Tax=Metabacillus kandeliae TaxID=2900151 RepID=UPI001E28A739|nr:(S)-benzoin forming benzil reductase [Metabacillus kandeliae]